MKNLIKKGILFITLIISCKSNKKKIDSNLSNETSTIVQVIDTSKLVKTETIEDSDEKPINIDSVLKLNINIDKEIAYDSIYNAIGPAGKQQLFNGQKISFARIENGGNVFAIVCPNVESDNHEKIVINFYILQNKKWDFINSFEVDDVVYFQSVDLNNDKIFEIQSVGHFNMNGNYYNNFFEFNQSENKFYNGGGFFSGQYQYKPKESRTEVVYEGSWYAPNIKTIYYWKNHKLIPYKEVEVGLKRTDMRHEAQYIKYSENLNLDKDSLEIKFKKNYRGKKLNYLFDNFFENN